MKNIRAGKSCFHTTQRVNRTPTNWRSELNIKPINNLRRPLASRATLWMLNVGGCYKFGERQTSFSRFCPAPDFRWADRTPGELWHKPGNVTDEQKLNVWKYTNIIHHFLQMNCQSIAGFLIRVTKQLLHQIICHQMQNSKLELVLLFLRWKASVHNVFLFWKRRITRKDSQKWITLIWETFLHVCLSRFRSLYRVWNLIREL